MGQTPEPRTEARTETTTLGMTSTVVPVGLEAIAKKMKGGDNKTAVLHLGEDSATPFILEGTLTINGETATISESGHIEVGASYTRAQTTAFPIAKALHMALGVMGAHSPQMLDAVLAGLTASAAGDDAEAALEAAGFNLSAAAAERATAHMKDLASSSVRTVSAAVKVSLD